MSLLRNLRNLAVLVILTVGGLGLTPRLAIAPSCPSVSCGSNVTGCHPCAGRICFSCVDLDQQRHCVLCKG
jgi:hypothetical protein